MVKNIFIASIFIISQFIYAQKAIEKVYDQSVNGIQFFNPETNDETPFFVMGGNGFILSFDMLDKGYERYYYKLKHYDRNWEEDNLFDSEYINGYTEAQIRDYQPSFNTTQSYTHYTLKFPNNDMQPKISGNYLFTVYNKNKKPLFSKKISFFENGAVVGVGYERYSNQANPKLNQRVTVKASMPETGSPIVTRQLSLCILQNNNWNQALCNVTPQFINGNRFTFDQLSNSFEGGNEFFSFDTKNIKIPGFGVDKVMENNDKYETILYAVIPYPTDYAYNPDVNGAYYFRRFDLAQEREAQNEGEYTFVNFFVEHGTPLPDADVYVVGMFNNYILSEDNKMEFNEELGGYQKSIYLKQGYYNYTFTVKNRKTGEISIAELPGSFWQTENLYQGLLYYTPFGGTYDALIGYGELRAPR